MRPMRSWRWRSRELPMGSSVRYSAPPAVGRGARPRRDRDEVRGRVRDVRRGPSRATRGTGRGRETATATAVAPLQSPDLMRLVAPLLLLSLGAGAVRPAEAQWSVGAGAMAVEYSEVDPLGGAQFGPSF